MIHSTEVHIDGQLYAFTHFPATKATKLLTRLMKMIGEPLSLFASAGGLNAELSGDLIGRAVTALGMKLDENEVERTVKDLLEGVRCNNQFIVFDTHFAGRVGHLFKVLAAQLKFQYEDFFGGLAQIQSIGEVAKPVE
jgi:hypothetical protein